MAEAMTVESIVEAYWQQQGFWTRVRFPFQPRDYGWSDIDILAYHSKYKILVISESKVKGPKRDVYVFTKTTQEKYKNIFKFDRLDKTRANYLSFLENLKPFFNRYVRNIFVNFSTQVKTIVIQLVSNYYIDKEVKDNVLKDIANKIRPSIPNNTKLVIRLDTTFDIICEIIKNERKELQGRRYGNSMLDIARELNRYLHPIIKYAGKKRKNIDEIKSYFQTQLLKSFNIDD